MTATTNLRDLASCPLDQLLSVAAERFRSASLNELAELIMRDAPASPASPAFGASAASPAAQASADNLAQAILSLPEKGSKLEAVQRAVILHAIAVTGGNVSAAARLLGIERKAFERKLAKWRKRA